MVANDSRACHVDVDAVVIGGGMVGLLSALALAGAGVSVAVVDRERRTGLADEAFDGRASAIAAGSQRVLAGLGLWNRMREAAAPILEIRVSDGASPLFLHYDHRDIGEGPLGYVVENRVIRRALADAVEAADEVQWLDGRTVVTLDRSRNAVHANLDDGGRIHARLAIAADGRNSPLRRVAGIPAVEWRYPQTAIVCTVAHQRSHRGIAQERFLPAGPFAILPLTGDRVSIVWTERQDLAPLLMALGDDDFGEELRLRFGNYLGETRVVGPRHSYPLVLCHAGAYVAPRLALVGDAAHAIHPIAGQGLNLGIRDVAALAETVVDAMRLGLDPGATTVLVRYQRWRRFDNFMMIAVTDGLNRLFSNDARPLALVRDAGLALVERLPPFKRVFMRQAMGTVGELPRLVRGVPL